MNLGSLVPWREKSRTQAPRDDMFDPLAAFRRDVGRVFDDFFNGFGREFGPPAGWQGVTPNIDVTETSNEIVVTAELPGLDEKDLNVTLAADVLTIKGEKKAEHEQKNGDAYYVERRFGAFSRSVRLPFVAGDEKTEAKYDKGVLTVRVPKPAELQHLTRRIEVKSG